MKVPSFYESRKKGGSSSGQHGRRNSLPVVAVNSNAATPVVQHQDMEIVDFEEEVNGDLIQKETLGVMQGLI